MTVFILKSIIKKTIHIHILLLNLGDLFLRENHYKIVYKLK